MSSHALATSRNPQIERTSWREAVEQTSSEQGEGCVAGLTKTQAEELLDWLEAHGRTGLEVTYRDTEGFEVRWR